MAGQAGYSDAELKQLHAVLHSILAEIVRVCDILGIPYFIQGGTAIGAYYENDILAWDDDVDVGMTRANYNRFLKEAPAVLGKDYFLQWFGSEADTPFYFAKVRKNGTIFQEEICKDIKMHQGIYVDIFPFDKVPDNKRKQRLQRWVAYFLNECFVCKEVWPYRHFGKCALASPLKHNIVKTGLNRLMVSLFSKKRIYSWLCKAQTWYNDTDCTYYNIVIMRKDHIAVKDIEKPQKVRFGAIEVFAPADLDTYLHHHYGNIQRYPPKEKRFNHRPLNLSFNTK